MRVARADSPRAQEHRAPERRAVPCAARSEQSPPCFETSRWALPAPPSGSWSSEIAEVEVSEPPPCHQAARARYFRSPRARCRLGRGRRVREREVRACCRVTRRWLTSAEARLCQRRGVAGALSPRCASPERRKAPASLTCCTPPALAH